MNSTKKLIAATALASFLAGAGTLQAADTSPALKTLKPMQGLSFDIGTKHASSYFVSDNGLCKLTLMVSEAHGEEEMPSLTAARFEVGIDPGKSARLDTAEGKSLEFTCQAGARTMSVKEPPRAS